MASDDTLVVAIEPLADASREERVQLSQNLTEAIEVQRLGDVQPLERETELPAGAKGDAVEIAGLVVSIISALPTVVQFLRSWRESAGVPKLHLRRGEESLTIEGGSEEQQTRLIEAWLSSVE